MAVAALESSRVTQVSAGRRFLVGTNVVLMIALAVAIVVVAQVCAFKLNIRGDMTSSGVNSLSEATDRLLRNLDQNVRLTSLYFETDREEEDQPRYRRAAQDLVGLYEATNRAKIRAEWINPLKDHDKYRQLLAGLRESKAFKEELEAYKARVDRYARELDATLRALVSGELEQIGSQGPAIGESSLPVPLARVEEALRQVSQVLEDNRSRVDALANADSPRYSDAINELRTFYSQLSKTFKNITKFASDEAQKTPGLTPPQQKFLSEAGSRYADAVAAVEEETTKLQDLKPIKFDSLAEQLDPTTNAILVQTDDDARVVDFSSVFPSVDQNNPRAGIKQRTFKGEEKLTSAILRVTHKEQTAVVFVRYGGQPLFMGGMMPGMPPAPLAAMKQQLEDANFMVDEWDVKAKDTPPDLDPKPTRTIFAVLNPQEPQRNPMMQQQPQEPPFGETQRQAILKAIGDKGRALFAVGWQPGPFGVMASNYELADYLSKEWGIGVESSALLIETVNTRPGEYSIGRRDFHVMQHPAVGDHPIVKGALAREVGLPTCAPLRLSEAPPEGVRIDRLLHLPAKDGLWGVKNIQAYEEQFRTRQYLKKEPNDLEGPFDLAVAAAKGDAKIVVVSSDNFAMDAVAFAQSMSIGAEGLIVRLRHPGNVSFLVNALHWLNDKTEFMDLGKPIEAAVLKIPDEKTEKAVQAVAIAIWPALALLGGGVVWWVRRR